jgi:hypothetical protein
LTAVHCSYFIHRIDLLSTNCFIYVSCMCVCVKKQFVSKQGLIV